MRGPLVLALCGYASVFCMLSFFSFHYCSYFHLFLFAAATCQKCTKTKKKHHKRQAADCHGLNGLANDSTVVVCTATINKQEAFHYFSLLSDPGSG